MDAWKYSDRGSVTFPRFGGWHEWHEDSRKSFRGNRIRCQHINASVAGWRPCQLTQRKQEDLKARMELFKPTTPHKRSSTPSGCKPFQANDSSLHFVPFVAGTFSRWVRLPRHQGRDRRSSTRGHEFLTCGIRAGDTDKLKTCRHKGMRMGKQDWNEPGFLNCGSKFSTRGCTFLWVQVFNLHMPSTR